MSPAVISNFAVRVDGAAIAAGGWSLPFHRVSKLNFCGANAADCKSADDA